MNNDFINKISAVRGESGRWWIDEIPAIVSELEKLWHLKIGRPFNLSYNYTAPAFKPNGSRVVIKIGFTSDPEILSEAEYLKLNHNSGVVKLIDFSSRYTAMMLEELVPGSPLSLEKDDKKATRIIAGCIKKLLLPAPRTGIFPGVWNWFEDLAKIHGRPGMAGDLIPESLISDAFQLSGKLLTNRKNLHLLHGDLHHENILLAGQNTYRVIDPKGVIAEKEYEVAAMIRNPHGILTKFPNPVQVLEDRLQILSEELQWDRTRMTQWSFVQTVLSAVWNLDYPGKALHDWVLIAGILKKLI